MNRTKEKFLNANNLTCLAQGLTGFYTHIDLRNDSTVSGKIEQVDGFMNVVVSDAVYTTSNSEEFYYDFFFVKERNVRYIHIPDKISIEDTIRKRVAPYFKRRIQQPRPLSLKMKRLLERQRETKARVAEIKKERLQKKLLQQQQADKKD